MQRQLELPHHTMKSVSMRDSSFYSQQQTWFQTKHHLKLEFTYTKIFPLYSTHM